MFSVPIKCTDQWHPKQGERVYVSHAVTKGKFESCYFINWWGGCLIIYYKNQLHRLHVRHSAMKPVLRLNQ